MKQVRLRKDGKPDKRQGNKGVEGKVGPKRKPDAEKKVNVSIYIKQADVDTLGGKERVREIMNTAIVTELSNQ